MKRRTNPTLKSIEGYEANFPGSRSLIAHLRKGWVPLARIILNNCAGISSPPITARLRYNPLIH